MRREKLKKAEKNFRNLMVIYFFMFTVGAFIFSYQSDFLLRGIITFGTWLGFAKFEPAADRFWVILSVAMMASIASSCFFASLDVKKTKHYIIPVLVSKITSSAMGISEFMSGDPRPFHYLVITLTDFPLFLLGFYFYIMAIRAEGQKEPVRQIEKKESEPDNSPIDEKHNI